MTMASNFCPSNDQCIGVDTGDISDPDEDEAADSDDMGTEFGEGGEGGGGVDADAEGTCPLDPSQTARGMVLTIKEEQYIAAARTVGASDNRIMWRHILPNASAPIIVQATVSVSYAILAEAGMSFLGLGVQSDTPTWGLILADSRSFISRAWWLGFYPGLFIMVTVLSINFLGDALRDLFDVRESKDLGAH